MTDQGRYIQLWKKYTPVISLLLKKTETTEQKLQFYKYEFEKTGARNKTGYFFSVRIINGKAVGDYAKKAAALDLVTVLGENEILSQWLKDKDIQISLNRSYELTLQRS